MRNTHAYLGHSMLQSPLLEESKYIISITGYSDHVTKKTCKYDCKKNKNSLYVNYSDHTFPFPCGIPKGQCFTAPSKAATAKL